MHVVRQRSLLWRWSPEVNEARGQNKHISDEHLVAPPFKQERKQAISFAEGVGNLKPPAITEKRVRLLELGGDYSLIFIFSTAHKFTH